jgi:hypothetical protein
MRSDAMRFNQPDSSLDVGHLTAAFNAESPMRQRIAESKREAEWQASCND